MDRNLWPELDYPTFKPTAHLLHMTTQLMGKLKLLIPFDPHWANVALWLTARGFTTGLIPYRGEGFSLELDIQTHTIVLQTTWGHTSNCALSSMSVAQLTQQFLGMLEKASINVSINLKPQEIPNPIPFDQSTEICHYDKSLVQNWWRIMLSTYFVLKQYHSHFDGESPPIGLMWGTFDLRDARYNGEKITPTGINTGYIRRNAMNEAQVEVGFWPGNELYPKPAFYSFVYPQPTGIEKSKIKPSQARWDANLFEFVLDYDDLRQSTSPEKDLLDFFESTYRAGAKLAGWSKALQSDGVPA